MHWKQKQVWTQQGAAGRPGSSRAPHRFHFFLLAGIWFFLLLIITGPQLITATFLLLVPLLLLFFPLLLRICLLVSTLTAASSAAALHKAGDTGSSLAPKGGPACHAMPLHQSAAATGGV